MDSVCSEMMDSYAQLSAEINKASGSYHRNRRPYYMNITVYRYV